MSARAAFAAELERSGLVLDEGGRLEGLEPFVEAYRERTKVIEKQADALSRLADVAEGKVLVS